jgi:gluconolactonase
MFRDVAVVLDDRFQHLFKGSARLEKLAEGCRWAEGPAYFPAGRYLVWSDIPNDRMMRFDESSGAVRPGIPTATRSTARAASSPASTATEG